MSRFQMGDMVFAAQDLYNEALEESGESSIPGLAPDALLAAAGTRGVVVNVGHAQEMPEEEIYLVRFEMDAEGTLAEPIGCLTDELSAKELSAKELSAKELSAKELSAKELSEAAD